MSATARNLLVELRSANVALTVEFDQLRVTGPAEVLDATMYQRVTLQRRN
jgi:hypothetical protein